MNTKKKSRAGLYSFDAYLDESLKDPKEAVAFLKAALAEGDKEDLEEAFRRVVRAQGNVSRVARDAGLTRQTIHNFLKGRGEPTFSSLSSVLEALGARFDVALRTSRKAA